jgi:hypothetical protein
MGSSNNDSRWPADRPLSIAGPGLQETQPPPWRLGGMCRKETIQTTFEKQYSSYFCNKVNK